MKRIGLCLIFALALLGAGSAVYFTTAVTAVTRDDHDAHKGPESGPLSNATVSFGGWMTDQPLDRFPNNPNTQFPRTRNHHRLTPTIATIKAGGTVNFIIGGFHVVTVYDDGVQPTDINMSLTQSVAVPPGPPIINDPNRRIYRGLDPTTLPLGAQQDRVEVVHFDRPGTYLVICSVLPHFAEGMYGYVRVL
jgi:plastocyanin